MANALPLLLGAAAVFMLMGKGGAVQTNVHIVDKGDTKEAFFAKAASFQGGERVVAIFSTVAGLSQNQIGAAIHPYAQANPKVFFVVFAGPGLEVGGEWMGLPLTTAPTGRLVSAVANAAGSGEATSTIDSVTSENAAAELDDLIKWSLETELTSASSGGAGGLQISARTAGTANASLVGLGLASAATPGPSGNGMTGTTATFGSGGVGAAVSAGAGRIFGA